ncbi:sigma-70 family RNA polymerase sigma factor [Lysinibacillus sp. 54212]|uniref:sigma-70 family RNA polymerase sigma factor n=1 Tax=Lysinibacillus sp. 54212 TaxID=3119829 RepID=UPI002FCB63BA
MLVEKEMNEVMDTYSGYLLQLSYLYVKNWATAEDIVQESFIKYFRYHEQFKGEASLKTYLGKITIHTCHDYLRSWKGKSQVFSQLLLGKAPSTGLTVENQILRALDETELTKQVLGLPLKYREAIILFYYEELTTAGIASLLGLSENTVKTRLKRAREMLKLRLNERDWEVLRYE